MATTADELISQLRRHGISYLVATGSTGANAREATKERWSRARLLAELAQTPHARVHEALIPLLVLQPGMALEAQTVLRAQSSEVATSLGTALLAALGVRYVWHLPLALALGHAPSDPSEQLLASLREERRLPAPWIDYGEALLQCLEAQECERSGLTLSYRMAWEDALRHGLWQRYHTDRRPQASHRALTLFPPGCHPRTVVPGDTSSVAEETRAFLRQLASMLQEPCRLYVGSETALMLAGLHAQPAPIDIILAPDAPLSPSAEEALAHMRQAWVPDTAVSSVLPFAAWHRRTRRVFASGPLEVYAPNWATLSISKIALGTTTHIADVHLLATHGYISAAELDATHAALRARSGRELECVGIGAELFQEISAAVRQLVFA